MRTAPTRFACTLAAGLLVGLSHSALAAERVELKTSAGRIVLELDTEKAPQTVENFLGYVRDGFYTHTVFHRVIDGFMIQGGGFDAELRQKRTREPIKNEAANGLKNQAGTIAMARTRDPHSATAQFFINLVDNSSLDHPSFDGWGYAVFGRVVEGMDVVQKIGKVPTGNRGMHQNVPETPLLIESATLLPKDLVPAPAAPPAAQ